MLHHYKRAVVKIIRLDDWKGDGSFFSIPLQIGSGAKPSPYPMDIDVSFSRLRRPGCVAYTSLPPIAEVKHMSSYASNLPKVRA
jgi:hypothetical protein